MRTVGGSHGEIVLSGTPGFTLRVVPLVTRSTVTWQASLRMKRPSLPASSVRRQGAWKSSCGHAMKPSGFGEH